MGMTAFSGHWTQREGTHSRGLRGEWKTTLTAALSRGKRETTTDYTFSQLKSRLVEEEKKVQAQKEIVRLNASKLENYMHGDYAGGTPRRRK